MILDNNLVFDNFTAVNFTTSTASNTTIDLAGGTNFNIGNAFKYLWRAGIKDDKKHIEDLQKAIFYIQDEINRLEGNYE